MKDVNMIKTVTSENNNETDKTDETDVDNIKTKHPTNTKWIVWYHNPSDKSWTLESYKDIIELSSIEDYHW